MSHWQKTNHIFILLGTFRGIGRNVSLLQENPICWSWISLIPFDSAWFNLIQLDSIWYSHDWIKLNQNESSWIKRRSNHRFESNLLWECSVLFVVSRLLLEVLRFRSFLVFFYLVLYFSCSGFRLLSSCLCWLCEFINKTPVCLLSLHLGLDSVPSEALEHERKIEQKNTSKTTGINRGGN